MPSYKDFEELPAWIVAKDLALDVYKLTQTRLKMDFSLVDQMRRAAVSVSANIAEGFGRGSDKEFVRYIRIASGSVHELRSHLSVAMGLGLIGGREFDDLRSKTIGVARQLGGFAAYLQRKPRGR